MTSDQPKTTKDATRFLERLDATMPFVYRKCGLPSCSEMFKIPTTGSEHANRGFCLNRSKGINHAAEAGNRRRDLRKKIAEIDAWLAQADGGLLPRTPGEPHRRVTRRNLREWRKRLQWEYDGIPYDSAMERTTEPISGNA